MNTIQNFIDPHRLLLAWQSQADKVKGRSRRIVAEIVRNDSNDPYNVTFRYLLNEKDFKEATKEGFNGFPAFDTSDQEHHHGILETFIRRLPPRNREDFGDYLSMFCLPHDFSKSNMALLAYTGAKLPGDGFEIAPDLVEEQPPIEIILEVAGFRYQKIPISDLKVGAHVQLIREQENSIDPQAIAVMDNNTRRIGYISRPYIPAVQQWLNNYDVKAVIERLNGKPDRPIVYLFVTVR